MRRTRPRAVSPLALALASILALTPACGDGGAGSSPTTAAAAPTTPAATTTVAAVAPTVAPPVTGSVPGIVPVGFDTVPATITDATGAECVVCLWSAQTGEERRRGLMHVTDLGGAAGMAFRYGAPTSGAFTMRNTVMPLSIAFFGDDGAFLDAFDMTPCTGEPCPSYPTPAGFLVAVEVPQGGLDELGIGPGSTLTLDPAGDTICDGVG